MARNQKNTNTNENTNSSIIEKTFYTFIDESGEEIQIDMEGIKEKEKEIFRKRFDSFAEKTTFNDVCMNPVWDSPYIGMHESGKLKVFTKESNVNMKRFISSKFAKEELKELEKKYRPEIKVCNAFLNHIAIDGEKVSVNDVKEKMNLLNDTLLRIHLTLTDSDDKEYILSCTNKMVRIMLVDMAKSNSDVSGFKRIKIADFINVIMTGLSKEYNARKDG